MVHYFIMAKKKSSKKSSGPTVKVRVGSHKVKAPLWVFLILLIVGALSVGLWFLYQTIHQEKETSSTSKTAPATSRSIVGNVAPLDIYLMELGNAHTGDSIYVKAGENDILIDAGSATNSASTIEAFIDQHCTDKKLEYVVATHAHDDHISCFPGNDGIFAHYDCRTIIDFPKYSPKKDPTKLTTTLGKYVAARDAEVSGGTAFGSEHFTALECYNAASSGTRGAHRIYTLGENLTMEILYNPYYEKADSNTSAENNYSVSLQFIQGNNHYLFLGDAEEDAEDQIVAKNALTHCVFYKADHHGSKTSTGPALMKAITPTWVGVSCCAGNYEYSQKTFDYTFPCQRTINTLAKFTDKIMVTTLGSPNNLTTFSSYNGVLHVQGNGPDEKDVTMKGSNNDTFFKDSAWFKESGNQVAGTVDEGDGNSHTHTASDPNRYWPEQD